MISLRKDIRSFFKPNKSGAASIANNQVTSQKNAKEGKQNTGKSIKRKLEEGPKVDSDFEDSGDEKPRATKRLKRAADLKDVNQKDSKENISPKKESSTNQKPQKEVSPSTKKIKAAPKKTTDADEAQKIEKISPQKKVNRETETVKKSPNKQKVEEEPQKPAEIKKSPAKKENVEPISPQKSPNKTPKQSPSKSQQQEVPKSSPKKEEVPPQLSRKTSYYEYIHRGPPPNKGKKEIPIGAPNCLAKKYFLITGVLDSLEREDAIDLIKRYGGGICKSVTKKLTHVVMGDQPGMSKMEKIQQNPNIILLDEDGLLNMIRSSLPPSSAKTAAPPPPPPKLEPLPPVERQQNIPSMSELLWADKHKPKNSQELIANPGPIKSLADWLSIWKSGKIPEQRAALLSGNPGIGKTSTAILVASELGFEPLEFNASDVRNKASIRDQLAQANGNKTIGEFYVSDLKNSSAPKQKRKICLIMDEVDGMSSGDRGGIAELILLIKKTRNPIICVCNDRSSQKIRSLANYCLDIRFRKPTVAQASSRIIQIARKEGFSVDVRAVEQILESVNCDIRQTLNLLQMLRATSNTLEGGDKMKKHLVTASKNVDRGPFDVVPSLFYPKTSISDKFEAYFVDSSLIPLMVHENYMSATRDLDKLADAAESISDADLIDIRIRRDQQWELSNVHAVLSSIRPAALVQGNSGRTQFPSWLGKNSSANKRLRFLREIQAHMSPFISGDKMEVRTQYLPFLKELLIKPLIQQGMVFSGDSVVLTVPQDGIDTVLELMDEYGLTKEDWDAIIEITELTKTEELLKKIPANVKSQFTRKYNNTHHAVKAVSSSKRSIIIPEDGLMGEGTEEEQLEGEEEEKEDDLAADKLIKVGKTKSKGKGTARGKKQDSSKSETAAKSRKTKRSDQPPAKKKQKTGN